MNANKLATTTAQKHLADYAGISSVATVWGIVAGSILADVKIVGGILGNCYALIADGIESLLDILSSLVCWGSLRISTKPPN